MKIAQINGGIFGSTGTIMLSVAKLAEERGHEVFCAAPVTKTNKGDKSGGYYRIGNYYSRLVSVFFNRLLGDEFAAICATKKLVKKLKEFRPDVLQLHNLHGGFINPKILFDYAKESGVKVVWTLHDCWAFSGHCTHFIYNDCDKWKAGCNNCPSIKSYPKTYFDNSKRAYALKKEWFTGVENMTIITPSDWLAAQVKASFLGEYPVLVIKNGIDLNVFRPMESKFRNDHGIGRDKFVLLGVAFAWNDDKGLSVFKQLSERLSDEFAIVLVGTDSEVEKKLPKSVVTVHRTKNQEELAKIYSAADLFVNPTRGETFPTVNVESLACGTPVLTFDSGGSPETIDLSCGSVVRRDDVQSLIDEIIRIKNCAPYSSAACLKRAKSFCAQQKFAEYIKLYEEL